jgi:general secretion pathway protein E
MRPAIAPDTEAPDAPDSPTVELQQVERLADTLTADYLEHYGLLPLRRDGGRVLVATWREAVDVQALDDLRFLLGAPLDLLTLPEAELRAAIRRVYGGDSTTAEQLIAGLAAGESPASDARIPLDDLVTLANEAPVVRLVNLLLLEALDARASDVHLEVYSGSLRVRYRIDGVLQDMPAPPTHLAPAIVSRIKIMAELDIAERRVPQDGRIQLRLQSRRVDVRVSTLPTLYGESVVLRLLDREQGRIALEDLGMADDTFAALSDVIARPHGIVLATGPTGSGKTTTLYGAVGHIRTGSEKILAVEDPVEYELPGVPQVPVNEKVGVTFATALRALLRQDPDILLVGEIRDEETAEIATHAALTGHLVLSTLHTNDAPAALTRLVDLGVAPYLVASTVEAVLAQRLVRVLCDHCKHPVPAPAGWHEAFHDDADPPAHVWLGRGCEHCRGTGYRGRTGIYELLVLDDAIRDEVLRHHGTDHLRRHARAAGMRSLREDGVRLVRQGVTTPDEVLRVAR